MIAELLVDDLARMDYHPHDVCGATTLKEKYITFPFDPGGVHGVCVVLTSMEPWSLTITYNFEDKILLDEDGCNEGGNLEIGRK